VIHIQTPKDRHRKGEVKLSQKAKICAPKSRVADPDPYPELDWIGSVDPDPESGRAKMTHKSRKNLKSWMASFES
jgi:hypothetical protein